MSKIFLIGDTHLSMGYPNSTEKWYKIHKEYFSQFLIPLLKKEVMPGDIIVHLGDYFDNRSIIPIHLLNYGMDVIEEISKIAPLHIIIGNHDLWSKSASEINSLRPFRYIPNVKIYDKVDILEYNGLNILMMPYIESKSEQIKIIKENKNCHYLFCHSDLNGCKMHLTSVAHKNNDKIDVEEFSSFKKVFSAHIHIRQSNKNFTFVGSIFQMDRNDIGDQKGITVIDTKDGSEEFFPNKISPIFKKLLIRTESDILSLDGISTRDFIDLKISNSLLINNRKLRRKLELILETGNFASVEYLDDVVIESASEKTIIDEVTEEELQQGIIPSLELEYTEIIKDFITEQKYNSDKIKNGILEEFSKITDIYNQNYKSLSE